MKVKIDNTVTITANMVEIEKLLNAAEEKCQCAVEYVGSANYADREREAKADVTLAFSILRDNLLEETDEQSRKKMVSS